MLFLQRSLRRLRHPPALNLPFPAVCPPSVPFTCPPRHSTAFCSALHTVCAIHPPSAAICAVCPPSAPSACRPHHARAVHAVNVPSVPSMHPLRPLRPSMRCTCPPCPICTLPVLSATFPVLSTALRCPPPPSCILSHPNTAPTPPSHPSPSPSRAHCHHHTPYRRFHAPRAALVCALQPHILALARSLEPCAFFLTPHCCPRHPLAAAFMLPRRPHSLVAALSRPSMPHRRPRLPTAAISAVSDTLHAPSTRPSRPLFAHRRCLRRLHHLLTPSMHRMRRMCRLRCMRHLCSMCRLRRLFAPSTRPPRCPPRPRLPTAAFNALGAASLSPSCALHVLYTRACLATLFLRPSTPSHAHQCPLMHWASVISALTCSMPPSLAPSSAADSFLRPTTALAARSDPLSPLFACSRDPQLVSRPSRARSRRPCPCRLSLVAPSSCRCTIASALHPCRSVTPLSQRHTLVALLHCRTHLAHPAPALVALFALCPLCAVAPTRPCHALASPYWCPMTFSRPHRPCACTAPAASSRSRSLLRLQSSLARATRHKEWHRFSCPYPTRCLACPRALSLVLPHTAGAAV
ncbi:hypothetical protein DENSPDRAFT_886852 [Dentipellis sp. KUC8613]|nr:hypothetical protein DENSPDRAFT_886852 [Dentipellis sp. KUC8613]